MPSASSEKLFARRVLCASRTLEVCVPVPSDYPFLTTLRNRSDIRRWFGDERALDPAKAAIWLAARTDRSDDVLLLIRYRPRDCNVGSIGWSGLNTAKGTAEFGRLATDPGVLKKLLREGESIADVAGIAPEAALLVRDFAFQNLGIRTMLTCYKTGNANAAAINRHCGLTIRRLREGDDPRMTYLELSREDWLKMRGNEA